MTPLFLSCDQFSTMLERKKPSIVINVASILAVSAFGCWGLAGENEWYHIMSHSFPIPIRLKIEGLITI